MSSVISVVNLLLALLISTIPSEAPPLVGPPVPASLMPRRALDVEKRRIVAARRFPSRILTCDVLVAGGGVGGIAAAEALARRGRSVIVVEPTRAIGGQFTAQCVPVPDENSYIERAPGSGTRSYRQLREELRAWYAAQPGIRQARAANVGQCWVSRVSGEPAVWEGVIRSRLQRLGGGLAPHGVGGGGVLAVVTRHQLIEIRRFTGNDQYHYADFVDLDGDRVTRVAARYLLDATEMGDGIALAGLPWVVGAEGREAFGEPDAPETPRPEWIQSFTYCFVLRWTPDGPHTLVEKPAEYEAFKALGAYSLDYLYSDDRGRVTYKVFERAPDTGGPFWTYRRLVAATSFTGNPRYATDLSLINWPGNDFHEENPIGKALPEQVRILERGRAFARGFLYWLQTECPRDDGGVGYPEMQLATDLDGMEEGFALHPYIRESRRILADVTLTENDLLPDAARPEKKTGTIFPDSVGIALYAIDIHPSKDEPPLLARALPYTIPLGALIAREGAENVLPAAKNFGGTRLALASARMHPIEWLVGEAAGLLAAFCLDRGTTPRGVRASPELLAAFQARLLEEGITLNWDGILP